MQTSQAAIRTWNNPLGGIFAASANWSAGAVPGVADIAHFSLDETYTVNFNSSPVNLGLEVVNGDVTFDLNGNTYILIGTGVEPAIIGLYGIGNTSARLRLIDGIITAGTTGLEFQIGEGEFHISTGGQLGDMTTKPSLYASSGGSSRLVIDSNGKALAQYFGLGVFSGEGGSALVTGPQASLSVDKSATIGSIAPGDMMLTDSASVSVGELLTIGYEHTGQLIVSNGGQLTSASSAVLGNTINGTGRATVSGPGSRWSASSIEVGNSGSGELSVIGGGEVSSTTLAVGVGSSSTGVADFVGAGTRVVVIDAAVAGSGNGSLHVRDSAEFEVIGNLQINNPAGAPNGTLEIDGGAVYVQGSLLNSGTLNFTDGLLRVAGNFQPNAVAAGYAVNGDSVSDRPILELVGTGTTTNVTSLTVGSSRSGELRIQQGRLLNLGASNLNIGAGPGGEGTVSIESGSELQTTALNVGGHGTTPGGAGTFNITDAIVITSTLRLFSDGEINFDGGQFSIGTIAALSGQFNWTSGELFISGLSSLPEGTASKLLGPEKILRSGQKLSSFSTVSVAAPIVVDGGHLNLSTLTNNSTLEIHRGIVEGTAILVNYGFIQLNGPLAELRGSLIQNEHTIRGSGLINGELNNTSTGQIQLITGERLRLAGASNSNSGHISVLGGELQVDGSLNNGASTGLISARDAILRFDQVTNNGSMAFSNGTVDVYGDIIQNVGGRITVSNGGIANFYDDITISVGAANVQATALGSTISRVVFFGSYNGGVSGGGQAFIEGDHRPGNSPALVAFGGDVYYGPFSSLEIELAGVTKGNLYDAVAVSGVAVLGGELDVSLLNTFSPTLGGVFEILTATGGVTGVFDSEMLPSLGPLLALHTFYGSNAVNLAVVPALPGDYNANGTVDAADYVVWRHTLGQSGIGLAADGTGPFGTPDGLVNQFDYQFWRSHFGQGLGSSTSVQAAVPEPAAWVLLMFAAAGIYFPRTRKVRKSLSTHRHIRYGSTDRLFGTHFRRQLCFALCVMTNPYLASTVKRAHGFWSRFSGFVDFLFWAGSRGRVPRRPRQCQ
jgi:T5SS/PEP-CTERM-associated repeat protein